MKCYFLTILMVIPLFLHAQQQIAPIPKNIRQVKEATLAAFDEAAMDVPTGPIGINVEVDEDGNPGKIRFYTEFDSKTKKLLTASFSELDFFPARKRGEAIEGRKDLTIILKPVSAPATEEPIIIETESLPPPPPFPGSEPSFNDEGLVDILGGSYRFPPVLFRRDLNDFSADELDSKPVFLNLKVLKNEHRAMFPDRTRRPLMLNVLVEKDGYVSDFQIKREQDRHFEIGQEWIDQMQFVPALREGEPVAVWVTVPFFVP